jgi:hypothetical protein
MFRSIWTAWAKTRLASSAMPSLERMRPFMAKNSAFWRELK